MAFSQAIGTGGRNAYSYYYDGIGDLTSADFPWSGGYANHTYAKSNGLTEPSELATTTTPYMETQYTYNARHQIVRQNNLAEPGGSYSAQFTIAYDSLGNKTSVASSIAEVGESQSFSRTQTFNYDARDELTQDQTTSNSYVAAKNYGFIYDHAYNATAFRSTSDSPTNSFNVDNQIGGFDNPSGTSLGSFSYDGNGNPDTYESSAYRFDAEDRLLSTPQFSATYGPDDKRASKTVGGTTTYYIYDEAAGSPNPILEEQGSGTNPTIVNAYGVAADGIRARYLASSQFYYVYQYDPMGNYLQRADAAQYGVSGEAYAVIDTAQYDAYGNMLADIFANSGQPATSREESIGFGGQYGYFTDSDTTAGLICLGHRYYDSSTGRFINRDPIGYEGGENLYAFCGGNPVNLIDPEGTDTSDGSWTSLSGYLQQVGQVFAGYGDAVNPKKIMKALNGATAYLGAHADTDEGSALLTLGKSAVASVNPFTAESSRSFGQRTGTDLIIVTPAVIGVTSKLGLLRAAAGGGDVSNAVVGLERTGSALKVDYVKPIYDASGNIVKEFPGGASPHGFPDIIDNYVGDATVFRLRPGVNLYQLAGSLNGVSGRFEWIVDSGAVTHRMFCAGGDVTGIPIK
jgi:RHS repeat-associated protein